MKDVVKIMQVLSDGNRLRVLKLLECRCMCVCELAAVIDIAQPSVSRHLKKLKAAGLISAKQAGFWTDYSLCCPGAGAFAGTVVKKILAALDNEPVINNDRSRAAKIDRARMCCTQGRK